MYLTEKGEITENTFYILVSSKQPPFALITALHTLGILSMSFKRQSPEMFFTSQLCLIRVNQWNFLLYQWGQDHQLSYCQPYWTTVKIHIMTRTNQLTKEKRLAIITLRNEAQLVRKIAKTLNVSRKKHQALQRNWHT